MEAENSNQQQTSIQKSPEYKPSHKNASNKYGSLIIIGMAFLISLGIGTGGYLLATRESHVTKPQENTQSTTEVFNQSGQPLQHVVLKQGEKTQVVIPRTYTTYPANNCQKYGRIDKDFYLDKYTVKRGDTLFSILNNQSNDPSRINELIELNKDRFPNLSLQRSFIEIGWELYLPPKFVRETNGNLNAYYAGIVEETDNYWNINTWGKYYSLESGRYTVVKTDKTKYLGKDIFHPRDCVVIVVQNASTAIAISPQDKNYFKERPKFTSSLYNYSIEYPQEWITQGYGDDPQDNKTPGGGYHERHFSSTGSEKEEFLVKVWDIKQTSMRLGFAQDSIKESGFRDKNIQEITVDGIRAVKVVGGTTSGIRAARPAGDIPRDLALALVVFQKGDYVYILQYEGKDLTRFEEVLSSFRFLK